MFSETILNVKPNLAISLV